MQKQVIDKTWFLERLREQNKSVRGLARHLGVDPSAASRMLSGNRKMKMEEASAIALFLGATVGEVLSHAGVAIDIDGHPTQVLLAATIDEKGHLHNLTDPKPLPQNVIDRARAAIAGHNGSIIAAQIRAVQGPLAIWDDAVVLFAPTDTVEPSAINTLSICRTRDGTQVFAKVERARKTGEAFLKYAGDASKEVSLLTAAPVLAIIP